MFKHVGVNEEVLYGEEVQEEDNDSDDDGEDS